MSSTELNLQVFCCRPVTNLVIQQCKDRGGRLWADGLFSAIADGEGWSPNFSSWSRKLVNVVDFGPLDSFLRLVHG